MEWLHRFNEVIDYIEEHLEDEIDLDHIAQTACCSAFHFQRMFSYIADLPLSEYIRRRRMTRAAADLHNGNEKIIDIALKYGYDSPTAFNRAFQSIHGIAPSLARKKGVALKAFPPISFSITIKGDVEMNYRIETKDAFKIVGVKKHYSGSVEECMASVPLFWQKTIQSGVIPDLCVLMNGQPNGLLGVSTCMDSSDFDYFIAVATNEATPPDMSEYTIPQCTWAIFESVGPMPYAIQNLQKQIVTQWLPASGYEYANAPDIEVYFEGDQSADDYKCEVWLPIVIKNN
jgi:AraC family transcriptional regulator